MLHNRKNAHQIASHRIFHLPIMREQKPAALSALSLRVFHLDCQPQLIKCSSCVPEMQTVFQPALPAPCLYRIMLSNCRSSTSALLFVPPVTYPPTSFLRSSIISRSILGTRSMTGQFQAELGKFLLEVTSRSFASERCRYTGRRHKRRTPPQKKLRRPRRSCCREP